MLMQQAIEFFKYTSFDVINLYSYHFGYLFSGCKLLWIIRMCLGTTHELIYILWYPQRLLTLVVASQWIHTTIDVSLTFKGYPFTTEGY